MWYVAASLGLHLVVVLAPVDEEIDLPLPMEGETGFACPRPDLVERVLDLDDPLVELTHEPREHEVMRARIAGFLGDITYEGEPAEPSPVPSIWVCTSRACWVGEGGLDEVVVQRYLKRARTRLELCKREGMVDFLVVPDGTVVRAYGSRCLVDAIRAIQFPPRGVSSRISVWVGRP